MDEYGLVGFERSHDHDKLPGGKVIHSPSEQDIREAVPMLLILVGEQTEATALAAWTVARLPFANVAVNLRQVAQLCVNEGRRDDLRADSRPIPTVVSCRYEKRTSLMPGVCACRLGLVRPLCPTSRRSANSHYPPF